MYGLVSDPDLEAVTMRLTICGADYQGFNINGINWDVEVSTAICLANGLTDYDVTITATDESGASTQLLVKVNAPVLDQTPIDPVSTEPMDDDALPSFRCWQRFRCWGLQSCFAVEAKIEPTTPKGDARRNAWASLCSREPLNQEVTKVDCSFTSKARLLP